MDSTLHLPNTDTPSVWTDEKHLHFLNTMEASFVNTMLHRYGVVSTHSLRLDRYLPDTSESTLDSKPNRRPKKHASSGTRSSSLITFNSNYMTAFRCTFRILLVSVLTVETEEVCLTKQHVKERNSFNGFQGQKNEEEIISAAEFIIGEGEFVKLITTTLHVFLAVNVGALMHVLFPLPISWAL
ncbi:hypothetical protein CR513_61951, partial [Mucuna pruriens]